MNQTDTYSCLYQCDIFTSLVDEAFERANKKLINRSYDKGSTVFTLLDTLDGIYIIRSGQLKAYTLTNGKETVVDIMTEGDIFGSFTSDNVKSHVYIEATTDVSICNLKTKEFKKIIESDPNVAVAVINDLAKKLQESHKKLSNVTTGNAEDKVLKELQRLCDTKGTERDGFCILRPKLNHQQIADMTGLTRESVSHVLSKLKKEGKVKQEGKRFFVKL